MKFTLAQAAHEPQLRHLARMEAMPGWIRLAFTREPDWFLGQNAFGHTVQTIVAEDAGDRVCGCGVRAVRRVFVNGQETNIGYLCGLRSIPAARRKGDLARGYRFLRQLHDADSLCRAYLVTIVEGNAAAALLTSERAGLPACLDHGRLITSAIPLSRFRAPRRGLGGRAVSDALPASNGLVIRTGAEVSLDDILGFLNREGRRRQFFPVLGHAEVAALRQLGFDPADFRVALGGGEIVGVAAVWDQRSFRQAWVGGYAPLVRWTRPLLNAGLGLAGCAPLPPPGNCLNLLHAVFTCIRGDHPDLFAALLDRLCADHRGSPYHHLIVGLHARDPLRAALRRFPVFNYASRLYLACWEDGRPFCDVLDHHRTPHLEPAML